MTTKNIESIEAHQNNVIKRFFSTLLSVTAPFLIFIFMMPAMAMQMSQDDAKPNAQTPKTVKQLSTAIEQILLERDIPGASVALVNQHGPVLIKGFGVSNYKTKEKVTDEHRFRFGSVSKLLVGLSALKLVEQGELSLNDTLKDLAPEIKYSNPWQQTHPIKVVHLLEHTTGWGDVHLPEYNHNSAQAISLKDSLDFHPDTRQSRWIPGSRMAYSNAGTAVAAYIVEKVSKQPYEEFVKAQFFSPLGMQTADYKKNSQVVSLHSTNNVPDEYKYVLLKPAGALNATASDMAKLVSFFIHRGQAENNQLMLASSIERMERTESTSGAAAGLQSGYGITNYSKPHKQWHYRSHNGALPGGFADFSYLPAAQVGHAIAINSSDFGGLKAISNLIRDFETQHLVANAISPEMNVTETHKSIAGTYLKVNSSSSLATFMQGFDVHTLSFEKGQLVKQSLMSSIFGGTKSTYFPVSLTQYKSTESGLISLTTAHDPLIGDVVHAATSTLQAVSPVYAYGSLLLLGLWLLAIVTSILFFLVWGVRKAQGKIAKGPAIQIRLWPLLASLCPASIVGLIVVFGSLPRLATPSGLSISIFMLTIAYGVFAIFSVITVIKHKNEYLNRYVLWHSTFCSMLHITATLYLFSHDAIGYVTWQ